MERILIVEDSPFDAELVSRAIHTLAQPYQLEVVSDAESGLHRLVNQKTRFNMIISDHSLPGISGLEFCKTLRKNGFDMPFILMTSVGNEVIAAETFKSGGNDYLVKDAAGTFAEQISEKVPEFYKAYVTKKFKRRIDEKLRGEILALKRQVSDLEAFAQTVSHELKAPLTILMGYANVIAASSDADVDEELSTLSNRLVKLGRRSIDIVDSMLAFSLAESMPVQRSKVDMQMVLHNVMHRLVDSISMHQVQFQIDRPILNCYGYAPWIEEIWFNYISNAIKYGGRPAKVIISSVLEENQVCYWVTDNGYGLDNDSLDQVFEPFYRYSTHQVHGTGLGLSIAKRIVERLNGQVGVRSKVGLGSSFFFTLPYLRPESFKPRPDRYSEVDRQLQYQNSWQFE